MNSLTVDYLRTTIKKPDPILLGLDSLFYSFAGKFKRRTSVLKTFMKTAEEIDLKAELWRNKTDKSLRKEIERFKDLFQRQKRGYEESLPDALAALREASDRCLGLWPYKVQLVGTLALYHGYIAEMATGEGKTLTASLTAILRGWSRFPCHIITVNDYLADRDSKWSDSLYKFCGVSVGCVTSIMKPPERRLGYSKDVTYTTAKEIVADFLRDRLWLGNFQKAERRHIKTLFSGKRTIDKGLVMRGIHSTIIDEADSILIDEAVTPLIISRAQKNDAFVEACQVVNDIASTLKPDIDYRIDQRFKDIELLPTFDEYLDKHREQWPTLLRGSGRCKELISQALNAKEFFANNKQYVIQDGKVVIVDEFTGRLMPMRSWRAGLHQLVEAKENLDITAPTETLARLSFQRFFRFFHTISGMTGTAKEASVELWHIYGLPVMSIPLNKPCKRQINKRKIFIDQQSKWDAIVDEIVALNKLGRPVLVGTRSVKSSEILAERLLAINLEPQVLNAIRHEEEAEIVSHAGEKGVITVATNMAGRGTDIRLDPEVAMSGGLHVIATECHESSRIDRQLFGRSARQGDRGSARSFVSMDDELIKRYLSTPFRKSVIGLLKSSAPSAYWAACNAVKRAQNVSQALASKRRRSVLKMDTWLEDSLSFAQGDVDE